MTTNQAKENKFVVCIATRPDEESYFVSRFQIMNDGVPEEIVIAQLQAYIQDLKKGYSDDFNQNSARFSKE